MTDSNNSANEGTEDLQKQPSVDDTLLNKSSPPLDTDKPKTRLEKTIIIWNFFVAMFGVGLNYGIRWTLGDLKSFYDDYNVCQDGTDIKWIVYVNIFITFVMGLVTTQFTDFGNKRHRYVVCIGGVMSMFGLFLSWYASNTTILLVTYGFITGVGFGLMLPPSLGLILGNFNGFALDAVLAVAFMVASICLLFIPPLFEYVKVLYGKRSVFVILACVYGQLACIVLVLSLLPIKCLQRPCDTSCMGNKMKCLKFSLLKKPLIFDMMIGTLLIGMGQNIMVVHLKQVASERDLQLSPIYYGSAMIFGCLCFIIIPPRCNEGKEDNTMIINLRKFGVSLIAVGVAVIGSVQTNSFAAFIGINIISAAGSGFYLPLMFVLLKAFNDECNQKEDDGNQGQTKTKIEALRNCKEQDDENQRQTETDIEVLRFILPAFGIGALIGLPVGDVLNTIFGDGSSYYLAGVTLILACPIVLVRGHLKPSNGDRKVTTKNQELDVTQPESSSPDD